MANRQSIYQSIAMDIAKKITAGHYPVGTKLSGRSLLSSQYSVSSETIRKSVNLLRDSAVVQVSQGKEITVTSKENASHFIQRNHIAVPGLLQEELDLVLNRKQQIDKQFEVMFGKALSFSEKLKNLQALLPEEITIPGKSPIIGKTLEEIALWHNTGATLVAVLRGAEMIISPNPATTILENDRIFVVAPGEIAQKVADYIGNNPAATKTGIGRLGAISTLAIVLTESSYTALNLLFDPLCQTCLAILCEYA